MNLKPNLATRAYGVLIRAGAVFSHVFLLLIRVGWGGQFVLTGWGKLKNLKMVTEFFGSIGIPLPRFNALLASTTECFGGLLLLLGLGARLVSVPLAIIMLVAY